MSTRKLYETYETNIPISRETLPRDSFGILKIQEAKIKQLYPEGMV